MNRANKLILLILETMEHLHSELSKEANDNYNKAGKFNGAKRSLAYYSDEGYRDINPYLREGKSNGFVKKQLNKLQVSNIKSVTKNPTQKEFTVYRASKHIKSHDLKHGDIIHDKGFTSTSLDPHEVDREFSGTKFKIHIKPGTKGHYIGNDSFHPREKEFLLHPGTKFKVGNISYHPDGNNYLNLHIHSQED